MISVKSNLHIVRASAIYDLVVTAGFTTPWTAAAIGGAFAALSQAFSLEGPAPVLDGTAMLFANLLGSLVMVWSVWRLMHASHRVGRYDAVARALFALWQLYAVAHGASFLILVFTVFEIAFGVAQLLPADRLSNPSASSE